MRTRVTIPDWERDLIEEEWKIIREFPTYSVSTLGNVHNNTTGRILQRTFNQQGIPMVGFTKDKLQYKRSVALLVARAFIPRPFGPFDTPINLDGDRENNVVTNLMWRPRWFAILYHRQFRYPYPYSINQPIIDIKSQEVYNSSIECCVKFGLLERDLVLSINNRTYVWPTYQEFRVLAE